MLANRPGERPGDWIEFVNDRRPKSNWKRSRQSVNRGRPFGDGNRQKEVGEQMGLQATLGLRRIPGTTTTKEAN